VLPVDWLRKHAVSMTLPSPEVCAEGFDRYAEDGERGEWFTHRGESLAMRFARHTDGRQIVTWLSAQLGERTAALVWSGGMGYRSQPDAGPFELWVDGKKLIEARLSDQAVEWIGADGARLKFVPHVVNSEDRLGIFYLTLPPGSANPGRRVELSWRATGSGSRRWVSVAPYRDVVREIGGE
jgi:hypothetical protein